MDEDEIDRVKLMDDDSENDIDIDHSGVCDSVSGDLGFRCSAIIGGRFGRLHRLSCFGGLLRETT